MQNKSPQLAATGYVGPFKVLGARKHIVSPAGQEERVLSCLGLSNASVWWTEVFVDGR